MARYGTQTVHCLETLDRFANMFRGTHAVLHTRTVVPRYKKSVASSKAGEKAWNTTHMAGHMYRACAIYQTARNDMSIR